MIAEAWHIALVGMGYVFFFLGMLICLLFINTLLTGRMQQRAKSDGLIQGGGSGDLQTKSFDTELTAAIIGAAEHHQKTNE